VAVKNGAIGEGNFYPSGANKRSLLMLRVKLSPSLSATQSMCTSLINFRRCVYVHMPYSCSSGFGEREARDEKEARIKAPLYARCIDK
jgi:hypothetical protein